MTLAAYSHAAAAVAYGVFSYSLLSGSFARKSNTAAQLSFTAAVVISAAWAMAGLAAELGAFATFATGVRLLDLSRYAAWFVFALVLLRPRGPSWPVPTALLLALMAIALVAIGVLVWATLAGGEQPAGLIRNVPLASLALPVVGLVLIEQIFRSTNTNLR